MSGPTVDERLKLVKQHLRDKRFDEAIGLLEAMLAEDPDSSATVRNLGAACFAAGRFDDAIAHFERLSRLLPTDATAFVNLGAVQNRVGNFGKAGEALRKAVQRDGKCAAAYYNLGITHRGQGSNALAVSSYREALRLDPDMVDAHFNLANVLVEMGNHQQAILHYREALARRPDFAKAERALAKAEQAANESRQAFSPFGRLVDPKPKEKATAPKSTQIEVAVLNEEQRTEDRNLVHDVAATLRTSFEEMEAAIRERFEPAIVALNKVVAQGKSASHLLSDAHEKFHAALETVHLAREGMTRATTKLREHEAELLRTE